LVDSVIDWLRSVPSGVLYSAVILLSLVENVFPPVPADVVAALGAFLCPDLRTAALLGVACWLANTASSCGMYFLARSHKDFFRHGWPRRLLTPEAMQALEHAYTRYGAAGIFVSRFLPAIRAAVTPFAGVVGLSPARALLPAAGASALWYALLVLAGTTLGREWPHVRHVVESGSTVLGTIGVVLTVLGIVWLWRRSRRTAGD
jgi:membrane protein DedA with SNARE-associated domain